VKLVALPKPSFSATYYKSLGHFFEPSVRPDGIVNLAVAENRLAAPLLLQRLQRAGSGAVLESLAYNPYAGNGRMRAAMARVISRHIAIRAVNPNGLVLTSGAGSALWLLVALLADAGQGVLVPTPYYYAYDRDFTALSGCRVVPVIAEDPLAPKALSSAAAGEHCRVLVVTSPNNPTGEVISEQRLHAAIEWAGSSGVDVVVNELYACSAPGFRSVLQLFADGLPPHVHFVWGLSKDFAANGLRCGCVYSGSDKVTEAMSSFAYFFQVGGTVQQQLAECLEDEQWVDWFLEESRQLLAGAVEATADALRSVGAPFRVPGGALFVWANLGTWASKVGGEEALFEHLLGLPGGGVLLCPGRAFRAPEGWFRICVTAAPEGHLSVGLDRLAAGLRSL